MTETVSNVFDIACPNPLKLQDISSLTIVEALLRRRICSYLKQPTGSSIFYLICGIEPEKVLPNMPRRIYDFLNQYLTGVRDSMANWLDDHTIKVFEIHSPDGWYKVLSTFHDFALDWNGTIHHVRTAKRILLCDRIGIDVKFRTACLYCFEDDIKRIWPSVCTAIDRNEFHLQWYPDVYYWRCFLRNELHKIPNRYDEPFDEFMLYLCGSKNYSFAQYFWNRIPLERRSQTFILDLSEKNSKLFSRFILPKLTELQLEGFLRQKRKYLTQLMDNKRGGRNLVLPIWMYIRNKIDKRTLIFIIKDLLSAENDDFEPELFCEIWNSAAQSLKQSVFDDVLLEGKCFSRPRDLPTLSPKQTRLLKTVLSDVSFEERSAFCSKHWPALILGTCVEDLVEIMKFFFRNEQELALFKENTLFKYENIKPYLTFMLNRGHLGAAFHEVNKFLYFCNSDPLKRWEMKQRFLRDPNNGVSDLVPENEELANEFLYLKFWRWHIHFRGYKCTLC